MAPEPSCPEPPTDEPPPAGPLTVHAACVRLGAVGVLLRGPSGSGKSDLALRLIDHGAELVADDRVTLERRPTGVIARPPAALRGVIELRGLGLFRLPFADEALLALVVDLGPAADRLPPPRVVTVLGTAMPAVTLDPASASAPARLRCVLARGRLA